MAVLRERPYVQFNFLVDLGTGNTDGPQAGFQEISGIGMVVTVSEYRTGNSIENSVMKITSAKMKSGPTKLCRFFESTVSEANTLATCGT